VQYRVQLLKSSVAECSILIAASSSNWPTLMIISAQFCCEQRHSFAANNVHVGGHIHGMRSL